MNAIERIAGFSILECLLALLITASLIFLGVTQYKRYEIKEELAAININVDRLFEVVNVYYRQHCNVDVSKGKTFSVSKATLKQLGLWPTLIKTNLAPIANYDVHASLLPLQTVASNDEIYQLYVTVKLASARAMNSHSIRFYQHALSASDVKGNQLEWMKLPGYNVKHGQSPLWVLDSGLQRFKNSQHIGSAKVCG